MTDQEQNIAVAKECGWKEYSCGWWFHEPSKTEAVVLPNYGTDLNAMHEAEKLLDVDQLSEYCQHLFVAEKHYTANLIGMYEAWTVAHATAAQRAEAFLRTIGKWKD